MMMMLECTFLVLAHVPAHLSAPPQDGRRIEVRDRYVALAAAGDAEGLRALWLENRDLILVTLDSDLEESLALWEAAPEDPPAAAIEALERRALAAAEAASAATGHPIFADYAASFVGWDEQQRRLFRAGQAVYRRALRELEDGNYEVALEAGRETRERAQPLGDWWGVAMGWAAEARALQGAGHLERALAAYGTARLHYHDLGLLWGELENLRHMLDLLRALERWPRARVAAEAALAIARRYENADDVRELLRARALVERRLGLEAEAAATEAEARALGGSGDESDDERR